MHIEDAPEFNNIKTLYSKEGWIGQPEQRRSKGSLRVMVFNATFNNISVMYKGSSKQQRS
jgi:hypothetical protein